MKNQMSFKYDLHVHSKEMSRCSNCDIYTLADEYEQAGFDGFTLVNHFNTDTVCNMFRDKSWGYLTELTYETFLKLKDYAGNRLNITFGLEIAFPECHNDYLVYGLTEETLKGLAEFAGEEGVFGMGLEKLHEYTAANGALLIQAHPFRYDMLVKNPEHIDGYEIYNGSTRHNSNNEIAEMWAKKYGKLKTAGSDHHRPGDAKNAGIITAEPITGQKQLADVIRSGDFRFIKEKIIYEI